MKKLMVFAMAAMVALASCTKTELVDNSAPTPISFKTVKGSVTKSDPAVSSVTLNGNVPMGVFAYVNTNEGHDTYFENYKFVADNSSRPTSWGHEESKAFWPFESSLDFVVYAPWESENNVNASYSSNILTISNANISPNYNANSTTVDLASQTDYLYGASYFNNTDGKGYTKTSNSVNVNLNHAAAKVTVSFTGSDITICDVSLEEPVFKGDYTVTYNSPIVVNWEPGTTDGEAFFDWDEVELSGTAVKASMMVVPETKTNIYFTYKIADTEVSFTAKVPVTDTWAAGTHYTYNINVTPLAITFNPKVNENWVSQDGTYDDIVM